MIVNCDKRPFSLLIRHYRPSSKPLFKIFTGPQYKKPFANVAMQQLHCSSWSGTIAMQQSQCNNSATIVLHLTGRLKKKEEKNGGWGDPLELKYVFSSFFFFNFPLSDALNVAIHRNIHSNVEGIWSVSFWVIVLSNVSQISQRGLLGPVEREGCS